MQNTHKYTYIYNYIYIITWRLKRKIVIQQNVRDVILEIYIHTLHYLTIPYFTLPYENFVYSEATWATLKIPQSNFSLSLSNNHLWRRWAPSEAFQQLVKILNQDPKKMFVNCPCTPRCLTFLTCPAAAKVSPVSSDDPSNPGLEPVSRPTPTSRWCRRWQRWHTQSCVAGLALAVKQKSSSCVALAVKLKVACLIR